MELLIENLLLEKEYGFAPTALFKLEDDVVKSGRFLTGLNVLIGTEFDFIWPFVHTIGKKGSRKPKGREKIYLDGKEISLDELKKMTHYLTYYDDKFPHSILKTTVEQHIKMAIRRSEIKYSYEDIIKMFQLKETFLKRRIKYLSHNRWIYSFVIGFARGNKVFCLRWMREEELSSQLYRLNLMEDIAKKEELIVIIPMENIAPFLKKENEFTYRIVELK